MSTTLPRICPICGEYAPTWTEQQVRDNQLPAPVLMFQMHYRPDDKTSWCTGSYQEVTP